MSQRINLAVCLWRSLQSLLAAENFPAELLGKLDRSVGCVVGYIGYIFSETRSCMNHSEVTSRFLAAMNLSDLNEDPTLLDYIKRLNFMIKDLESNGIQINKIKNDLIRNIGNNSYITHACKFSLLYYFFKKFPKEFKFHVSSNISKTGNINDKMKNYDLNFLNGQYSFHIEVKTFEFSEDKEKSAIKMFLSKEQAERQYRLLRERGLSPNRTLMTKISKALKDANEQLPRYQDADIKNINIAMICCNDLDEYADALTCLIHSKEGILSLHRGDKIRPSKEDLDRIDAILLCNLGFEHNVIMNKTKLYKFYNNDEITINGSDIWDYRRNIPVLPMHLLVSDEDKLGKEKSYQIQHILFSHTAYYKQYCENDNDIQNALFFYSMNY